MPENYCVNNSLRLKRALRRLKIGALFLTSLQQKTTILNIEVSSRVVFKLKHKVWLCQSD